MRVTGDWHSIVGLLIRIGSENVAQNRRGRSHPSTPALSHDSAQHVAFSIHRQLQFLRHAFAHDAHAIFVASRFVKFVAQDLLWKTSFALETISPFGVAIPWSFANSFFVRGMPMMLHSAKNELHISFVLLFEIGCFLQDAVK